MQIYKYQWIQILIIKYVNLQIVTIKSWEIKDIMMSIATLYGLYQQNPFIQTDSRKLKKGQMFFALSGINFDGNAYAEDAIEKGASYAIIDQPIPNYQKNNKLILVNNVLTTLQQLALYHRLQFNIPFISVTGSNGKTTTKQLIYAVLGSSFKTFATVGNLNNHIGIPLTILSIPLDAEIAVIEMGANHLGEIADYCTYTLPTIGIITNCGRAHLEQFGGEEQVKIGKGQLYKFLIKTKGLIFYNSNHQYLVDRLVNYQNKIAYGVGGENNYVSGSVNSCNPFLNCTYHEEDYKIVTQLVGDYNLDNILAAIAVGKYFKIPTNKIVQSIEQYRPKNLRSQFITRGTCHIILDAYNANPSSMEVAIKNFAKYSSTKKKVVCIGAMKQLGKEANKQHQNLINLLQLYEWENVIIVGSEFQHLSYNLKNYQLFVDSSEALGWLKKQELENLFFFIKGSRSMKMQKLLDAFEALNLSQDQNSYDH